MKAAIVISVLVYNAALIAGTVWLVGWHGWSGWWFLLAMCLFASTKIDEEK